MRAIVRSGFPDRNPLYHARTPRRYVYSADMALGREETARLLNSAAEALSKARSTASEPMRRTWRHRAQIAIHGARYWRTGTTLRLPA